MSFCSLREFSNFWSFYSLREFCHFWSMNSSGEGFSIEFLIYPGFYTRDLWFLVTVIFENPVMVFSSNCKNWWCPQFDNILCVLYIYHCMIKLECAVVHSYLSSSREYNYMAFKHHALFKMFKWLNSVQCTLHSKSHR